MHMLLRTLPVPMRHRRRLGGDQLPCRGLLGLQMRHASVHLLARSAPCMCTRRLPLVGLMAWGCDWFCRRRASLCRRSRGVPGRMACMPRATAARTAPNAPRRLTRLATAGQDHKHADTRRNRGGGFCVSGRLRWASRRLRPLPQLDRIATQIQCCRGDSRARCGQGRAGLPPPQRRPRLGHPRRCAPLRAPPPLHLQCRT